MISDDTGAPVHDTFLRSVWRMKSRMPVPGPIQKLNPSSMDGSAISSGFARPSPLSSIANVGPQPSATQLDHNKPGTPTLRESKSFHVAISLIDLLAMANKSITKATCGPASAASPQPQGVQPNEPGGVVLTIGTAVVLERCDVGVV